MNEIVYLNGRFINRAEAKISPDDRGFNFADGVYEVVKYYAGKPFRFACHLSRLRNSLAEVKINYPEIEKLETLFSELLELNGLGQSDAGVYLQITRGQHQRVHFFPESIEPTVYATVFGFPSPVENLKNGIKVITHDDIRWLRCDIKSVSLLPNTMIYNQAVEAGAGESILIRNGFVTEATHSSVLGVKSSTVITHPLSNLILPGITRKVVLEICNENNIAVEERAFTEAELYEMDELIIAGTGSEITPATEVNGKPVGDGKPGPVTRFIQAKFFEAVGTHFPPGIL